MNILSRVRGGRKAASTCGENRAYRQPAVGGQFSAIIHPNFTFEATGAQGSGAGFQDFQARGQWELAEGGIALKGQMLVQIFGLVDFFFFSQPAGANNLALTFTLENGNIHSNFCIRFG